MDAVRQALRPTASRGPEMSIDECGPGVRLAVQPVAARRRILPVIEVLALGLALILPLVLQDYLTVFATRVVILALFALSFDLVWGYAGIMSFGQALFFGSAG